MSLMEGTVNRKGDMTLRECQTAVAWPEQHHQEGSVPHFESSSRETSTKRRRTFPVVVDVLDYQTLLLD